MSGYVYMCCGGEARAFALLTDVRRFKFQRQHDHLLQIAGIISEVFTYMPLIIQINLNFNGIGMYMSLCIKDHYNTSYTYVILGLV